MSHAEYADNIRQECDTYSHSHNAKEKKPPSLRTFPAGEQHRKWYLNDALYGMRAVAVGNQTCEAARWQESSVQHVIQRQAKPEAEAGAFQNNRGIFDI
jgi:hypothetical protein